MKLIEVVKQNIFVMITIIIALTTPVAVFWRDYSVQAKETQIKIETINKNLDEQQKMIKEGFEKIGNQIEKINDKISRHEKEDQEKYNKTIDVLIDKALKK